MERRLESTGLGEATSPPPAVAALRAAVRLWEVFAPFGLLALQLGLCVVVIYQFQIESRAFLHLSILTFFGFAVHYFLPLSLRLPFFLLLSLAGIGLVFGVANGAWLVALGLVLFGICHLPVSLRARVAVLLAAGALLAALRVDWLPVPWSAAVWPLLGSMFMFRIAVYLYDIRFEKEPAPWSQRLAYFFMLPNICFPLYPVIDYKSFRRTWHDRPQNEVIQVGLLWIIRGILHLILYRFVYTWCVIPATEVGSFAELARFMLTTFLLYLRVSGQFHLIIGMLHLFGFNLPETHHLYYLASSFNDFWRRINIYWKDFMMKLFYYPAFFELRKRGQTFALVVSTLFVFLGTWLLHSYQWFWLRGTFPLTLQDGLFWGILGGLVVANSLWEARRGRTRTLSRRRRTAAEAAGLAVRTTATFLAICVLWSLWNSESVVEWLSLWSAAARGGHPADLLWIPALFAAAIAVGEVWRRVARPAGAAGVNLHSVTLRSVAWIAVLTVIGLPQVYTRLGSRVASVVESLRQTRLNAEDEARLQKGYYEDLVRVDRFNSQLWELYMKRPVSWRSLLDTEAIAHTGDFAYVKLVPSVSLEVHGKPFSINGLGLRDAETTLAKPAGTTRIAMLGSSHVEGEGVGDGETIDGRLEELLDADAAGDFEVLNFGVSAYTPLEILYQLDQRVFDFEPDAIFFVAHAIDAEQVISRLAVKVRLGVDLPYPELVDAVRRAGIDRDTAQSVAKRKLEPLAPELIEWVYRSIVGRARERGIPAVWIYLPRTDERGDEAAVESLFARAHQTGFHVIDLRGIYEGIELEAIRVADWDTHPNAHACGIIARNIHAALTARRDEINLGGAGRAAAPAAAEALRDTETN
jgi:D-alanyl-lipoteichoic acid acyltransferase DltB (MBOAT superfamily)